MYRKMCIKIETHYKFITEYNDTRNWIAFVTTYTYIFIDLNHQLFHIFNLT